MKKIPLSPYGPGCEALVDDEEYEFLSQFKWTASNTKGKIYAKTNVQSDNGRWVNVAMHRMVIGDVCEDWTVPVEEVSLQNGNTVFIVDERCRNARKMSVDHVDGNGLNNCRTNLRHATCNIACPSDSARRGPATVQLWVKSSALSAFRN